MRHVHSAVFVHLVWATWDRLPLLNETVRGDAYRALEAKCEKLHAEVLALGGVEDHIHMLVRLPMTLAVADLMKHLKGTSAHLIAQYLHADQFFKWQGGYGAFSVSENDVTQVARYIARQPEHHAASTLIPAWELPVETTSRNTEERPM